MTVDFERPGTLPKPGPIGRAVRLLLGLANLFFFTLTLTSYKYIVSTQFPGSPLLWLAVALGVYIFAEMVSIAAGRNWGRWPQLVLIVLALAAMVFDLLGYGSIWGPALGLLVFVLLAYVSGHIGLSSLLGGLLAVPG